MFRSAMSLFLFSAMVLPVQAAHRVTLEKALKCGAVSATVTSTGGFQGECLLMDIRNNSREPVTVMVEAGRRMNSLSEDEQDILIVRNETLSLQKGETRSVKLKGYCCQASNRAPARGGRYDFRNGWDSSLARVGRYLAAHNYGTQEEQQAVWSVSDKRPAAGITGTSDSLVLPLRQFVASIKGEKLPWYTVRSCDRAGSYGQITTHPLVLNGKFSFNAAETAYATMRLVDASGIPVATIQGDWAYAGSNERNLSIPLKGLKPGKYRLEVFTLYGVLASEPVEI